MIRFTLPLTRTPVAVFDPWDTYASRGRLMDGPRPRTPARPIGRVEFDVTHRATNGGLQPFPEPIPLVTVPNSSGYLLCFGVRQDTRRTIPFVANTEYRLIARGHHYQPTSVNIRIPSAHQFPAITAVALRPGSAYPFPAGSEPSGAAPTIIRGTVRSIGGTPIVRLKIQAEYTLLGSPVVKLTATTEENGQWLIVVPDPEVAPGGVLPGPIEATFEFPASPAPIRIKQTIAFGQLTRVAQGSLVGRVVTGGGVPIEGATVAVENPIVGEVQTHATGRWLFVWPLQSVRRPLTAKFRVSARGFKSRTRSIELDPTLENAVRDFVLEPDR